MDRGSTQPPTEMVTRNIYRWDNGGRCVELTILPPSYADYQEIWEPQPPGNLRACNRPAQPVLYSLAQGISTQSY